MLVAVNNLAVNTLVQSTFMIFNVPGIFRFLRKRTFRHWGPVYISALGQKNEKRNKCNCCGTHVDCDGIVERGQDTHCATASDTTKVGTMLTYRVR